MYAPRIRIDDLSALLQKPVSEVRRTLVRLGIPLEMRYRTPGVDWATLASRLDARTLRTLEAAVKARHFDLNRCIWTVAAFPSVAALWDKKRNRGGPSDVSVGSTLAVWWRCASASDHVWASSPSKLLLREPDGSYRVLGCPFCSHHRTTPRDSLAAKHPDIAREWHPSRNGQLRPIDVAPYSKKLVWWQCASGHAWSRTVSKRTSCGGCPYCAGKIATRENCLSVTHPDLAAQWHPTKNRSQKPSGITIRELREVWWKCPKGPDHEWRARPSVRATAPSCPFCNNRRAIKDNCLASMYPEIARQWHPTLNGELTPRQVVPGAGRKVWWKCPNGPDHVWCCRVVNRTRLKNGCPCCSGFQVSKTNSLARTYPKVARQWHPTKNRDLKPSQIIGKSTKPAWWRCGEGHVWRERIYKRTVYHGGCPKCEASVKVAKGRRRDAAR